MFSKFFRANETHARADRFSHIDAYRLLFRDISKNNNDPKTYYLLHDEDAVCASYITTSEYENYKLIKIDKFKLWSKCLRIELIIVYVGFNIQRRERFDVSRQRVNNSWIFSVSVVEIAHTGIARFQITIIYSRKP